MIGQLGSFDRPSADLGHPLDLYLHGYVSARVMNLARARPHANGLPVCVSAAHNDGLVLALSAFSHSYNYRSAVLFGYATLVEDKEERLYAMQLITDSVVPKRWENTRLPPTNAELQSTSILKVKIESGSAKIRDGSCGDEKHDLDDPAVVGAYWTGVLPVYQVIGDPVPGPYNKLDTPAYMSDFIDEFNRDSRARSINASNSK